MGEDGNFVLYVIRIDAIITECIISMEYFLLDASSYVDVKTPS